MARYALSKYTVTITTNNASVNNMLIGTDNRELTIGGNGSYVDSIVISRTDNMYSTRGFATGGYVHDKNLSKVGTVAITLSQLSAEIQRFINVCNYITEAVDENIELTITVYEAGQGAVAKCVGCVPARIPEQSFAATSSNQTWTFNAGEVDFQPKIK